MEDESTDERTSTPEEDSDSFEASDAIEDQENEDNEGISSGESEAGVGAPTISSSDVSPVVVQHGLHAPMYRNGTAIEELSRLVNSSTRIEWHEPPPMRITADNGEERSVSLAGQRRQRSPSLEIIDATTRPATRRRLIEQARRQRRTDFIARSLEEEGFVFTGFKIV